MDQNQLHYGISLKLYFENKAFGPGMSVLLRGVESTGSLQGAAQAMNMAYSKAWKMLKESEKAWGFMLTERETGGRDGGGSTLTPQAVRLLETYDAFMAETRPGSYTHLDVYKRQPFLHRPNQQDLEILGPQRAYAVSRR